MFSAQELGEVNECEKEIFLKNSLQFFSQNQNGVGVVVGPTASGKTGFSIEWAEFLHRNTTKKVEIINADSRQIFTEISIITACPTAAEKKDIPHHLFEFLSPEKTMNVAEWRELALQKIEEILSRKNIPILCGGTGLFVDALTKNFQFCTPPDMEFREKMELFSEEKLWEMLKEKDPKESEKLDKNNKKAVIRALELCEKNRHKTEFSKEGTPPFPFLFAGITRPRKQLYDRINQRVLLMCENGMMTEAQNFWEKYGKKISLQDGSQVSHGLLEAQDFLLGKISLEKMQEIMQQKSRNYAKRQLTWWKKDVRIVWICENVEKEKNVDL